MNHCPAIFARGSAMKQTYHPLVKSPKEKTYLVGKYPLDPKENKIEKIGGQPMLVTDHFC